MPALVVGLYLVGWPTLGVVMAGGDLPMRFRLDPAASHVWFDAHTRFSSFRGQTRQVSGSFTLVRWAPPYIAAAQISIDAASLETGNTERDTDMRQEFLEVAKFPTIEFTALDLPLIRPAPDESVWDVVLKGQLTVHGVTRDVQVPTTVSLANDGITARGQVHLDMRDFKIRVPRLLLIPMQSEVRIGFDVLARPEP